MMRKDAVKRYLYPIVKVLTPLLFATCSGDSGTTPTPPTGLSISFAATNPKPGQDVEIKGIPGTMNLDGVYAIVSAGAAASAPEPGTTRAAAASAETTTEALVYRAAVGTPYLIAPLNPAAPVDGGEVEITLTGGEIATNTVPLTIAPLPPATFTVQDYVGRLQTLLSAWLTANGTSRARLTRFMDVSAMPANYYPLFIAQDILDSPDNPNSLRATVDGPIPFFENEIIDFDVANRLLSLTDIGMFLDEEASSVDSASAVNPAPSLDPGSEAARDPPRSRLRTAFLPEITASTMRPPSMPQCGNSLRRQPARCRHRQGRERRQRPGHRPGDHPRAQTRGQRRQRRTIRIQGPQ